MWSDNQKRIVCRLAFLLLCALPTAVIVYRIMHPQTADQWEQRIQAQLGVRTHIDSVETPGPYETILRGLEFFDADRKILIATELRILFGEVNQIWIDHPVRLDSNGLQYLVDQVNQQLIRSHTVQPRWVVMVDSAVVESNIVMDDHFGTPKRRELMLENLAIDMESSANNTTARMDFHLVDPTVPVPTGNPNIVSCSIQRERVPAVPGTAAGSAPQWVTLNTGTDALPCWLVSEWLPEIVQNLGTEVTFSGGVEVDTNAPDLQGQAAGQFSQVDLQLVTDSMLAANDLARWGTIELNRFQFSGDDVQHVAFLTTPGSGTPPVRIEKTLEVSETFDIGLDIRNAALQKYRQATGNTIRRRVTYPASETRIVSGLPIRIAEPETSRNHRQQQDPQVNGDRDQDVLHRRVLRRRVSMEPDTHRVYAFPRP